MDQAKHFGLNPSLGKRLDFGNFGRFFQFLAPVGHSVLVEAPEVELQNRPLIFQIG